MVVTEAWEVTAVTEPWEAMEDADAMEDTEAPMENTIWRTKKRTKQQKILKDTKVNPTFSL